MTYAQGLPAPRRERPATPLRLMRWFLTSLLVAVSLIALLVIATRIVRWQGAGAEAQAAWATMSVEPPPPEGESGFAELYLSAFDVPPDRVQSTFAAVLAAQEAGTPAPDTSPSGLRAVRTGDLVLEPRPRVEAKDGCGVSDCLATVTADPERIRAWLAERADSLAAVERALAADHLRSPFPPSLDPTLPPYQNLHLPLAAAALDAVDGRVASAYTRTCTLVAAMRRMNADEGESLIGRMIGSTFGRSAAELLLQLRRERPVATLPAGCAEAMATLRDTEALLCGAMRDEFRAVATHTVELRRKQHSGNPARWLAFALLYDWDVHDAWLAVGFSELCSPARMDRARRGHHAPMAARVPVEFGSVRCLASYGSCIAFQRMSPNYGDYARRLLDDNAKLRLLIAAQAVADGSATPREAVAATELEAYPVRWDDTGLRATISLAAPGEARADYTLDFSGLAPAPSADR